MSSITVNNLLQRQSPLRFIHASDLHLDRTLELVSEGPAHWEQRMLNVTRRGAERLFRRVMEENVEFLILSGDILNCHLSPPGNFLFLLEQFEQLKKAGIGVYWAGGEFDSPEDWSTAFPLPDNVHTFPSNSIQEYYFYRTGETENIAVAKMVGISRNQQRRRIRSSEFPINSGGLYTIAVANGDIEPESLTQRRIDFWALGGSTRRQVFHGNPRKKGPDGKPIPMELPEQTVSASGTKQERNNLPPQPYLVHYPGATVARTPKDLGSYGATLVEIPYGEDPVLTFFPTSPVRWINEVITLEATDDGGKLADELRLRIKNHRETQKDDDLFINWFVDAPTGTLTASLRRGSLTADLLSELRSVYGKDDPITWSVSLTLLLPEQLPKQHYEQQTILGDFLRSVKHFQDHPQNIINLEPYLPKDWGTEEQLNSLLFAEKMKGETGDSEEKKQPKSSPLIQSPTQTETQHRVLCEAAMVGLELLGKTGNEIVQ
jgi:DNA repair exonuclease SbcCD nuclease subunit